MNSFVESLRRLSGGAETRDAWDDRWPTFRICSSMPYFHLQGLQEMMMCLVVQQVGIGARDCLGFHCLALFFLLLRSLDLSVKQTVPAPSAFLAR